MTCPHCGQCAEFKGYRPRQPVSLLGSVPLSRAYYCCGRCGKGTAPWDEWVGLGPHRVTPGAERAAGLLGVVCNSFAEAAEKVLPEACGLHLSEATVTRISEDAGRRLGALLAEGHTLGKSEPWPWHSDAQGRTCAYVSADATSVAQQAAGGGPAEGRMPYVAAVYNPVPEKPAEKSAAAPQPLPETLAESTPMPEKPATPPLPLPTPGYEPVPETAAKANALPGQPPPPPPRPRMQARYVAGLYTLVELGLLLRRQAAQVGMERADVWIALCDAGSGLEDMLRSNFNRADLVVILDFWHPTGYLERLARALHPKDEDQAQAQAQQWCHTMKHQGGTAILKALQGLPAPRGPTAQEAYQEAVRYIGNNVHRMDYPYYLSQGWQIGSGPIESACKTVVGQRLKLAGMRWREYGTDNICHVRALFRSDKEQWDAFWERKVNQRSISYQQK